MENYSQNAFYALQLMEDGYASVSSIPSLSFCGSDQFSITAQFFALSTDGKIPLITQNGAFEFGIDGRNAYYSATGIGSHSVANDEFKLDADRWNSLGVTYDGVSLRIYVNGINALEAKCTANRKLSGSDIKVGGNFTGYMKFVRVYGKALTDTELRADRIKPQNPVNEMELCLDFSSPTPRDMGKYSKAITLNGNDPERKTALKVTGDGVAKPMTSTRVNNVLGTGSFTILSKIKPVNIGGNTQPMLFSNSNINSSHVGTLFYQGSSYPNRALAALTMGTLQYGGGAYMPYDEWSTLALVYNRSSNKAYYFVNGEPAIEYNIQSEPTVSAEEICIGSRKETLNGPFGGHIDSICIFDSALGGDTLLKYAQTMPNREAPGLAAYYSFNEGMAKDIISGEAITLSEGAELESVNNPNPKTRCTPVNLVNTLCPGTGGAAVPESNVKVADQLAKGDTTILAKVYPKSPTPEEGTVSDKYWNIFTIAPYGHASSMNLVMRHDTYLNKAAISIETPNAICSCHRVDFDQWVDVALIYKRSQSKIEVYVNGALTNTVDNIRPITRSEFALHLGNGMDMTRPYHGYIEYVAVFGGEVVSDRLQSYILKPPVFIEQDILALYTFNSKQLREQVSGTMVNLTGDAAVVLAQNTQTQAGEKECPDFPDNHTGTEYELWQANTIASIYVKFIHENYGLWPTGGFKDEACTQLLGSVASYIEKSVLIYDEVQMVLAEHEDMDPEKIKAMLQVLVQTGKAEMLNRFFYACVDPHTRESITKDLKDLINKIAIVIVLTVVLLLIGAVIAWFSPIAPPPPPPSPPSPPSPNPDPDDPDDDDDKKKYHIVSIDSITFCHTPSDHAASAIRLKDIQAPEWVNGRNSKNNPSHCAFISSLASASAHINVRFKYLTNDDGSYTAKIAGESRSGTKPLGSLDSVSINMKGNNTYYTVSFSLSHSRITSLVAGSFNEEIKWSNTAELVAYRSLGSTYHTIHLLANEPEAPWSANAGDGANLPTLNALNTWSEMLKHAEESKANTKEYFAAASTRWLHNSGKFVFASANQFAMPGDQDSLFFARDTFDNRVLNQNSGIQISPLDASLIIADSARIQGFGELGVAEIMSNNTITVLETQCECSGTNEGAIKERDMLLPMSIREVVKVGSSAPETPSDVYAHYVCSTKGFDNEIHVYDGAYKLCNQDGQLAVCANRRYAEEIYPYVYGTVSGYREMLLEADSVCPLIRFYMEWSNNLAKVSHAGMAEKSQSKATGNLTSGDVLGMSRPHFGVTVRRNMGSCVVHSFSFAHIKKAIANSLNRNSPISYIEKAAKAVIANEDLNTNQTVQRSIVNLSNAQNRTQVISAIKELLTELNNVENNLRSADVNFCWNSIIGEDYDPEKWYYVKFNQHRQLEIESSYAKLNNVNHDPGIFQIKNLPRIEGFYILDVPNSKMDGERLHIIKGYGIDTSFYTAQAQVNNETYHILGSSSNNYAPPINMSDTRVEKAFYQYRGVWQVLW